MEYLVANLIGAIPWLIIFQIRKDLRKEMIVMSLLAAPIALFDLWYVPSYWQPITLFNIPVGIEGFIFSFEVGGVAAALYEYIAPRKLIHMRIYHKILSFLTLLIVLPVAFLFNYLYPINITIGMHVGLLAGILIIILMRHDLVKAILMSAIAFFGVYFLALLLWSNIYPETVIWFTFENLPKIFIFNVPLYELTFGILFGAYWGNMYELLFGYRLRRYGE